MSTKRTLLRRAVAGLTALTLAGHGSALDRAQHGQYASCREGDCDNGSGTVVRVDRRKEYSGPWSGGRFVEGEYQVRYAALPARTFPMRMGADGIAREGTVPFATWTKKLSTYTGTFAPAPETFVTEGNPLLALFQKPDSVFKNGRYVDADKGYIYEGEFQYIPVAEKITVPQYGEVTLARGVYVMLGARIDEALDEVETGVFASNGAVGPDEAVRFAPASAAYLAQLQQTLAATRGDLQAQKAASARASREAWGAFLGVMAGAAVVAVANRAASGGGVNAIGPLQAALEGREDPGALARRAQTLDGAAPARSSNIISTAEYNRLRAAGTTATAQRAAPSPGPAARVAAAAPNQPVPALALSSERRAAAPPPPAAAPAPAEVIESNPYDRYPTGESWDAPLERRIAHKGWQPTRAAACQTARAQQDATIARDAAAGFVTAHDKIDCICQTTPRRGSFMRGEQGWLCVVYHRVQDTGKRRPDVAR